MQPLTVQSITKCFGSVKAVTNLSFNVESSEVVGIIGPNGAGKTTTIKMILGLLQPDQGEIRLFGKQIDDPAVRQRVGYMPESPTFYSNLTGRELLGYVGELFGMGKADKAARSKALLERVGLEDAGSRQLKTYSKGMLQRICLAQALVNSPELLFLDEPLDGLDPLGRIQMKEILLELKAAGTSVVFNSHILSDVEAVSDRIAIMDNGKLLTLERTSTLVPKNKTLEDVFIATITHAN